MKQIPTWLWDYAKHVVDKYNFDSSHDLKHFVNVYNYTQSIIDKDYKNYKISLIFGLSRDDSIKICLHAAFCHDLIDSKYVDSKKAIEELKQVFISNQYNKEHLDIIIFLIDNMSFSKQRYGLKIPEKYQIAMNIISDADKLDAYRVERVIAYQTNKNNDELTTKMWIKTILVKRILEYKDKWLKTSYAKSIAPDLHDKVKKYVDEHLTDIDMFDY
jgi:HD superfamily phosphodiesterase